VKKPRFLRSSEDYKHFEKKNAIFEGFRFNSEEKGYFGRF
jgi:hypothetical protein